jgi:hypothetical protein
MTAKFNDFGAKGFLLNTLPLDNNIDILLESKNEQAEHKEIALNAISDEINDIIEGK